jgi:hypothetical protein
VLNVKRCGFKIESLHRIVRKSEVSAITAPVTLVIKVDEPQRKNLCAAPRRISQIWQAVSGRIASARHAEYLQGEGNEVRVALRNDIRKYEAEYGARSSYVSPPPT